MSTIPETLEPYEDKEIFPIDLCCVTRIKWLGQFDGRWLFGKTRHYARGEIIGFERQEPNCSHKVGERFTCVAKQDLNKDIFKETTWAEREEFNKHFLQNAPQTP